MCGGADGGWGGGRENSTLISCDVNIVLLKCVLHTNLEPEVCHLLWHICNLKCCTGHI